MGRLSWCRCWPHTMSCGLAGPILIRILGPEREKVKSDEELLVGSARARPRCDPPTAPPDQPTCMNNNGGCSSSQGGPPPDHHRHPAAETLAAGRGHRLRPWISSKRARACGRGLDRSARFAVRTRHAWPPPRQQPAPWDHPPNNRTGQRAPPTAEPPRQFPPSCLF